MSQKSLEGIDIYLHEKERLIENMETAAKESPDDTLVVGVTNIFVKSLKTDVEFLKSLKSELIPK
jgi:hypothetical protein